MDNHFEKIWQAHDERNEIEDWLAASKLYKILGIDTEKSIICE
jgi:hypothetical protein